MIISSIQNIPLGKTKEKFIDGIIKMPFNKNELQQTIYKYIATKESRKTEKIAIDRNLFVKTLEEQIVVIDKTVVSKLAYRLEKDLLIEHEEIIKSPKINQIKEFSRKLIILGRKYDIDTLEQFGNLILKQANEFNIKRMRDYLEIYPDIVDKFVEIKQQNA